MRRLTAMVLAGALALGALAPAALADNNSQKNEQLPQYEQDFRDWEDDYWANESLARMITRGVIQGNGDATIASFRSVTRLEAAIMMGRLLELQAPAAPSGQSTIKASWGEIRVTNTKTEFTIRIKTAQGEFLLQDGGDVPEWGRNAILAGLREGFIVFDGASLSPMKPLNRLEAAIMMVKAAGLDHQAQARAGANLTFTDAGDIPDQLRGYIAIAVESGFVTGYEDGTFRPAQVLTRAEWAALLDRLDRQNGAPVTADGRQIKATVTAVSSGAVTVTTPVYPGGVTYRLAANAVIYKGGKKISLADIQADDQVIINLNSDRRILLLTVINATRQVSGKVDAFVSPSAGVTGSIRLNGNAATRTYTVNNQTRVTVDGRAATFADVRTGDQVTLQLDGAVVKAIAVKATATTTVVGTLEAIGFGSNATLPTVTVRSANNVRASYSIADFASIKGENGAAITLGDLNVGDELTLKVERDLVTAIHVKAGVSVQVKGGQVEAFVAAARGVAGAITIRDGGASATYTVTTSTEVLLGNRTAAFADVRIGDRVSVKLDGSRVTQITIKVDTATVNGTLAAVNPGSNARLATLTLQSSNNVSTTYTVAANATVKAENGATIALRDLHVGDQLTVKVERNLATAIQVKIIAVGSASGKVEAFVSPTATVAGAVEIRGNGSSTITYTVTGSTVVRLDGKNATFADIRLGDQVTLTLSGSRVTQIAIQVEKMTVTGKLEVVAQGGGSIQAAVTIKAANVSTTYLLSDHVTIKAANGTIINLLALKQGDSLTLTVERNLVTVIQVQ